MKANQIVLILCFFCVSCADGNINEIIINENISRSILPSGFDWESADWMPTPLGQSRIGMPWMGQGALDLNYGLEIINDYKRSDGWELVYNTFSENSPPLVNPYFILYNKYRGILRLYYYTTTSFVSNSSYITTEIEISSNRSCILNYLDTDFVDISEGNKTFMYLE